MYMYIFNLKLESECKGFFFLDDTRHFKLRAKSSERERAYWLGNEVVLHVLHTACAVGHTLCICVYQDCNPIWSQVVTLPRSE